MRMPRLTNHPSCTEFCWARCPFLQSPPAHHARSSPLQSHSQACIAKNYWMCRYEVAPRDDSLTLDTLWHHEPPLSIPNELSGITSPLFMFQSQMAHWENAHDMLQTECACALGDLLIIFHLCMLSVM